MSESLPVEHGAPTLAGIKTGNLFSCSVADEVDLTRTLCALNRRLGPHGVCILPMRVSDGRALIYLYRPDMLRRDLADARAREMLARRGYPVGKTGQCVAHLREVLRRGAEFPHEIGLFLGYPVEDVEGFIRHGAQGAKWTGVWKVYGDVDSAKARCEAFRRCTRRCRAEYDRHHTIERLVAEGTRA